MDRRPVVAIGLTETAFRYADYDTPFWARNNRSPGRWHRAVDGATQYAALHPDGVWAEFIRREVLRTEAECELVRVKVWALTVDEGIVADYSSFEKAEDAGFPSDALVDDDYTRCQEEGLRLRHAGYRGVVAPSAALPGCLNLTLFGSRVLSTWGVPTRLVSAIPACVVAVGGPPPGLVTRVRQFGEAHAGYEEFVERRAEDERARQLDEPINGVGGQTPDEDDSDALGA